MALGIPDLDCPCPGVLDFSLRNLPVALLSDPDPSENRQTPGLNLNLATCDCRVFPSSAGQNPVDSNQYHQHQHRTQPAVKGLGPQPEQMIMKLHSQQVPKQVHRQQPPLLIQVKVDPGIKQDHQFRRGKDNPERQQTVPKPMTFDPVPCHRNDQGRSDQCESGEVPPQHQHQGV